MDQICDAVQKVVDNFDALAAYAEQDLALSK